MHPIAKRLFARYGFFATFAPAIQCSMQKKRRNKQLTFWKKIRFKYRISLLNENSLSEVFFARISGLSAFLIVLLFTLAVIVLTSVIIINTPIRNYLPGYLSIEVRNSIISLALKTDSLERALEVHKTYSSNLAWILKGELPADTIRTIDSLHMIKNDWQELKKSAESETFIKQYEEDSRYNLSALPGMSAPDGRPFFYTPVKGKISALFNREEKHYGIDIAADPKESILSTLDGTVVFTGFDPNAGYVIQLQHANGLVSIYKHNAILLKKEGDAVRAGEAIAIAGNTGALSTGTHLHFELWENGVPINPEDFIVF
jgi:hypothetical protein